MLARARNDFGFFHGYDLGEKPAETGVSTEREVGGRFELRRIAAASPEVLERCGFVSPLDEAAIDVPLDRFEAVARCALRRVVPVITLRGFDEPSFIERDGSLP